MKEVRIDRYTILRVPAGTSPEDEAVLIDKTLRASDEVDETIARASEARAREARLFAGPVPA